MTNPSNPYERFGASFLPPPPARPRSHIAQSEKDAPMVPRGAAKALQEDAAQLRRYRAFWKQEMKRVLAGPHGDEVWTVMHTLEKLSPQSVDPLLKAMDDVDWFRNANDHTRFVLLGLIDDAIIRMRIRYALAPFDDSLPGEEPTVFEICRTELNRER